MKKYTFIISVCVYMLLQEYVVAKTCNNNATDCSSVSQTNGSVKCLNKQCVCLNDYGFLGNQIYLRAIKKPNPQINFNLQVMPHWIRSVIAHIQYTDHLYILAITVNNAVAHVEYTGTQGLCHTVSISKNVKI